MTTRKHKNTLNVTKKSYNAVRPNQKQLKIYCREHANTFNQFEKDWVTAFGDQLSFES